MTSDIRTAFADDKTMESGLLIVRTTDGNHSCDINCRNDEDAWRLFCMTITALYESAKKNNSELEDTFKQIVDATDADKFAHIHTEH